MDLPHPPPSPFPLVPPSSAPLNEACPCPHTSPGPPAPAPSPAANTTRPPPRLTNFGLPARPAPSSAPPLGLPGPGPLLLSLVGHSNPRGGPDPPLPSGRTPLRGASAPALVGSISPVPGAPSPPSGPSLCRTDKQLQLNQTLLPLLLLLALWRGPQPIARLPAYHQGWALRVLIPQSSGERRCSHRRGRAEDWTGGAPDQYREGNFEDGRGEEPLKSELPEIGGGTPLTGVYSNQ